jgi:hypothetical protein
LKNIRRERRLEQRREDGSAEVENSLIIEQLQLDPVEIVMMRREDGRGEGGERREEKVKIEVET